MMLLACECLNVVIESETAEEPKVVPSELKLTEDETNDPFFRQVKAVHSGKGRSLLINSPVLRLV